MKNIVFFLVLTGFVVIVPQAFGNCVMLPCDDANILLGEPNYRFVDFSYQNTVGKSITFILEKTGYGSCNSFNATIYDENGNFIWNESADALCDPSKNTTLVTSMIKIGFNEDHPIVIDKSGRYIIKIEIDDGSIEREFVARHSYSSISSDRTVYLSPLQQFKFGVVFEDLTCHSGFEPTIKMNDFKKFYCTNPDTKQNLINRGWAFDESTACRNPMDCIDSVISIDRTVYPVPGYIDQNSLNYRNLIDADNKIREIYQINPSIGPFNIQDVIVSYGIDGESLVVHILEKYYNSDEDRELIIKKITDVTNHKVDIEFSPSDGFTPTDIGSVFPYVWHRYLNQNNIQFSPKDQSYFNHSEGYYYDRENKVCSPLISPKGTEFYISSTFIENPFEITGTVIDKIKPDDCQKVWKTDADIRGEPERLVGLWVNNFFDDPKNIVLFAHYTIIGLDSDYSLDEQITFEFTETGYGNPCTPIKIVYYQDKVWMENIVAIDKIIRDCPVDNGDGFLSSTFDTSKDTEFIKSDDWVAFQHEGKYYVEISNENQPDGKVIASFNVVDTNK